jgi:hypothetical protein
VIPLGCSAGEVESPFSFESFENLTSGGDFLITFTYTGSLDGDTSMVKHGMKERIERHNQLSHSQCIADYSKDPAMLKRFFMNRRLAKHLTTRFFAYNLMLR